MRLGFRCHMSDDKKWSRDGGKKDEDTDDLPEVEATTIPEVEVIPLPAGNVKSYRKKKSAILWKISIDEAINYGFSSIKGVLPYLIAIIFCYAAGIASFYLTITFALESSNNAAIMEKIFLAFSFVFFVVAILAQLSLMIGLGYKFAGDVLLRAVRTHNSVQKK